MKTVKSVIVAFIFKRQQKMLPLHFSFGNEKHVKKLKGLFTELPLRSKRNFRVIRETGAQFGEKNNLTSEQVQTRLDICFHVAVAQRFTSVCWVF